MSTIAVEGLSKAFRFHHKEPGLRGSMRSLFRREMQEKIAVDAATFRIEAGEIVGFLGPNGAGKTTTLKMLCGLLYPSSGAVTVLDHVPWRREAAFLRRIALVMGQRTMLAWDIPAMETLLLQREMYSLDKTRFQQGVAELAAMLEVEDLLRVQVRKLSLGERMKMELLAALVHRPDVLFLDEPTIGLDVVSQQRVREFLRDLNREHGTTILLTSHYMQDIEALCPRVLVIDHGHLHFDGALSRLVEDSATHKQVHAVYGDPIPLNIARRALAPATILPVEDPHRLSVSAPREQVADVVSSLLQLGRVIDLSIEEMPVEQIIRDLFRRQKGAPPTRGETE